MIHFSPSLIPTQNQQEQLANVKGKLRSAQDQLQEDVDASYAAFSDTNKKASTVGLTLAYPTWINDYEWENIFEQDKRFIEKLLNEREDILNQYPDNKNVIEAYTAPDSSAITTDKAFLKCLINSREFWKAIYTAPTPHDIIDMMSKGGQEMSFTVNSSTASNSVEQGWAHAITNLHSFFSVYGMGQAWKKLDLAKSGETMKVTIETDKIDSFRIGYGDWYNDGYLANLKKQDYWAC